MAHRWKFYSYLRGQPTLIGQLDGRADEQVLGPYDSCRFAPSEKRQLVNRARRPVLVAHVMPMAEPPPH